MKSHIVDLSTLRRYERINIVGTSGSGKTTFARKLSAAINVPYYEIDELFWKANWQESSDDELLAKMQAVCSRARWILDGNYLRTTPVKWERVQLVVWLDLSLPQTVWQVTKRAIRRCFSKQELWPGTGNRETLRKVFFSKDSIIWWAITSYRTNRERYTSMMASPEFAHIHFVRLRSSKSIAACFR
jgi:ABC-type dipeptide/oligopeptide/nickel transport system ATPase component